MTKTASQSHPIKSLPLVLANQIAAGEVVERPASVVKELIENALDANAKRIQINIENGGCALIRVRDDGFGIPAAQLSLALDRHATSKVTCANDLEHIATLGFRGEALPSIAAVSRLELISCGNGHEHGARVANNGGVSEGPAIPMAHPQGTSVGVRELFFNIPARRKFLRSERTELGKIRDVVRQFALCHFDVEWHLSHHARSLFNLPAATTDTAILNRLTRVCGKAFTDNALKVDVQTQHLRIYGWASMAEVRRSYVDLQLFYINRRPVRDPLLRHALRLAYQGFVNEGCHPGYVLFLELPPTQVDVNVHPTKHEVRFHEARMMHDFVHRRLRQQLSGAPLFVMNDDDVRYSPSTANASIASSTPSMSTNGQPFPQVYDAPTKWPIASAPNAMAATKKPTKMLPFAATTTISLLLERHAIINNANRYWLLDTGAAAILHARQVLYAPPVKSRPLLLPHKKTVSATIADCLENAEPLLRRLGVDIRRTGADSVSLRQVPIVLAGVAPDNVLQTLIDTLSLSGNNGVHSDTDHASNDAHIAPALAALADQNTESVAQRLPIVFNALRDSDAATLPLVELNTERLDRWLTLK